MTINVPKISHVILMTESKALESQIDSFYPELLKYKKRYKLKKSDVYSLYSELVNFTTTKKYKKSKQVEDLILEVSTFFRKKNLVDALYQISEIFSKKTGLPANKLSRDFTRKNFKHHIAEINEFYGSFRNCSLKLFPRVKISKRKEKEVKEEDLFNRESITVIKDETKSGDGRRYFVTSAVAGQSLNREFFNTIQNYCKVKNAKLVILPMRGVKKLDESYPVELQEYSDYFVSEFIFNTNLMAMDKRDVPQKIQPLTGITRLGQKDKSLIISSPKQQMKVVPVTPGSYPHVLFSTGAITNPDNYANTHVGALAEQDHIIGGLVVEIEDQKIFHIRQIQTDERGGFHDLNEYFLDDSVAKENAVAIYGGDMHCGWSSTSAIVSVIEQINILKPEYFFTGDVMDNTAISHHEENNRIAQLNRPSHLSTLENELNTVADELNVFISQIPDNCKFVSVMGNHDEFLMRYVAEGRYINDRFNYRLALDIAIDYHENVNPIQKWVERKYPILKKKIKWLNRGDSLKVEGIECALHGDLRINGAFPSITNLENSFGSCVIGHYHTPQVLRNVWVVGTLSRFDLPYTKGAPSSWLHSNCVIYRGGQRQMLTTIEGKWKI